MLESSDGDGVDDNDGDGDDGGGTDRAFKPEQRRAKYCLRLNSIAVEVRM